MNVNPPQTTSDIEAFILVGGASSRMGQDKSRLLLGGETFVDRIHRATSAVARRTTLIGSTPGSSHSRLPTASDVFSNWGALGGLHAALAACKSAWALVVACDLPFVTADLFKRLASLRADFDAVAPIQQDSRPQPLCALYRTNPCLNCAQQLIASGERRPRILLEAVSALWVTADKLADLEGASDFFRNLNTPEEYAKANEEMKGDQGKRPTGLSSPVKRAH
jgi:molybdopterin-guanine dinucleotide biosynthesis protein A